VEWVPRQTVFARRPGSGARRVGEAMISCATTHQPSSSLAEIGRFLEDDHVHLALVVAPDGHLVTTINRADLAVRAASCTTLAACGTLAGRTVSPADDLDAVAAWMTQTAQRRAAVVDESGRLLGLLCLKKTGAGFCSDQDIRDRRGAAAEGTASR
jgi:CBS-domain-containing membrane protein